MTPPNLNKFLRLDRLGGVIFAEALWANAFTPVVLFAKMGLLNANNFKLKYEATDLWGLNA